MNNIETTSKSNFQQLQGIFNKQISLFDSALITVNPQFITIKDLLFNIQSGTYLEQVNNARELLKLDRSKYDEYKKKFVPGFTLSTKCIHRKSDSKTNQAEKKLIYHTGILQIDIDKIGKKNLSETKQIIQGDKHTLFCFTSIGGEGLKIGVMIDGDTHKESFLQAEQYYKQTYNLEIDKATKDIFRLCFVSYDTELFINPNAEIYSLQEQKSTTTIQVSAKLQKPNSNGNGVTTNNRKNKYADQGIENAKKILNDSSVGNRHNARCKAGFLLGGYIAGGFFSKEYALNEIQPIVLQNTDLQIDKAMKTIRDGIEEGMSEPITFEHLEKNRENYLGQKNGFSEIPKKDFSEVQSINKETGELIINQIPHCFWFEIKNKNDDIVLKIEQTKLYDYLKQIGIRKLILDEGGLKRVLVQVKDNVVSEIDIAGIQNLVNLYIESLPDSISSNKTKKDLHELLMNRKLAFINDYSLNSYIPFESIKFLQDSKDKGFFFFSNGFVEVSKSKIERKPYKELGGFIWKSQIIKHDFKAISETEPHTIANFDFVKFTQNICSIRDPKQVDTERHKSLISTIGYLLHNYKTTANKFAVVLTEANVDDEPQGRTGKGLLLQSIGKLRKVTIIDGKNFSFDSQFAFQNVELDTQILFFDDVQKHFNFLRLFSAITEGLSFERKHKDRINLNAEQSPKIVISTNYTIQGNSESDKGRKFEMELLCYYNANFKPSTEFGAEFFTSWNEEQWNTFYNFMLGCLQIYLDNESKIPTYNSETIDEKKLLNSTSKEFIDFADKLSRNESLPVNETYNDFLEYAGTNEKEVTKRRFNNWLQSYCEFKNLEYKPESRFIEGKTKRFHCIKEEV